MIVYIVFLSIVDIILLTTRMKGCLDVGVAEAEMAMIQP